MRGLEIIFEDRDILVVDKPSGLLTMGTEKERARTVYFALTDYVRKGAARSRNRIFIVHRLDRETSGVLVFAKNEETKFALQGGWGEAQKKYLAVVHGRCETPSDTITSYLAESASHRVYSTTDPHKGRLARTRYTVLKETRNLSLLEVRPLTGRKHQIRVQLANHGHPVVGDARYGLPHERYRRLALHARCLTFRHPATGEVVSFEAETPVYFHELVGSFRHLCRETPRTPDTRASATQ